MPLHLVLLQGTDWAIGNTTFYPSGQKKCIEYDQHLEIHSTIREPEIGVVIPVSGERTQIYNQQAGGALRSKHLGYIALDLVPANGISREDLLR